MTNKNCKFHVRNFIVNLYSLTLLWNTEVIYKGESTHAPPEHVSNHETQIFLETRFLGKNDKQCPCRENPIQKHLKQTYIFQNPYYRTFPYFVIHCSKSFVERLHELLKPGCLFWETGKKNQWLCPHYFITYLLCWIKCRVRQWAAKIMHSDGTAHVFDLMQPSPWKIILIFSQYLLYKNEFDFLLSVVCFFFFQITCITTRESKGR